MANEIKTKNISKSTFTITLASLAAGSSRQSTMINNSTNNYPAALLYFKIKSGATAPTAGRLYEIYLLRGNDPSSSNYRTDGAGASDAAITIENAQQVGTIVVTNTSNKVFYGDFDTSPFGPLGPEWGVAVKNASDQALHGTEGDHYKGYVYYVPEVQ
jgi:hypothetical protein